MLEKLIATNETRLKHGFYVGQVAGVGAFKFREGLTVGIVVIEIKQPVACDVESSFTPSGKFWDEIRGTCQFDVYREFIFQGCDRLEEAARFRVCF